MDIRAASSLILSKPLAVDPSAVMPLLLALESAVPTAALMTTKPKKLEAYRQGSVAIIPVSGFLSHNPGILERVFLGATSYSEITDAVEGAVTDASVSRIILDVDSPGGGASGCIETGQAIAEMARRKPITAFISDTGASAAYAIAVGAGEIHVAPTARIGSIGTILTSANYVDALAAQGIDVKVFQSGALKGAGHPHKLPTAEENDHLQASVDQLGELFRAHVLARRPGVSRSAMEGQLFIGSEAVRMRIADRITNSLHSHTSSFSGITATTRPATITARSTPRPAAAAPAPAKPRETDPGRIFDTSPQVRADFGSRSGFIGYFRAVADGRKHDAGFTAKYLAGFSAAELHTAATGEKPDSMTALYLARPELQNEFTDAKSFAAYARGVQAGSIPDPKISNLIATATP